MCHVSGDQFSTSRLWYITYTAVLQAVSHCSTDQLAWLSTYTAVLHPVRNITCVMCREITSSLAGWDTSPGVQCCSPPILQCCRLWGSHTAVLISWAGLTLTAVLISWHGCSMFSHCSTHQLTCVGCSMWGWHCRVLQWGSAGQCCIAAGVLQLQAVR